MTYNRYTLLEEALSSLIPKLNPYGIQIIVVDNCSTDETRLTVERFFPQYKYLSYYCQPENLGYDLNFETALKLSQTPYTWVLGDASRLVEGSLLPIFQRLITCSPDAYVIDSYERAHYIPAQTYTSVNDLIRCLGWHMTLLSATIFSRKIIENAKFEKYRNTNFLHFGILFEYFASVDHDFLVMWDRIETLKVSSLPKQNTWNPYRVISVFGGDWTQIVISLPESISMEAKKECIKAHGERTSLFVSSELKKQRAVNGLNWKIYWSYRKLIPYFAPGKGWTIFFISILPNCWNEYCQKTTKMVNQI